jgi:hypothetical protein
LLQALQRAREREDVAQFAVDADLRLLAGEPVAFRIGDLVHETEAGRMVTHRLAPGQDPLVDALRADIASGGAPCEVADTATFEGHSVARVRFRHPQVDARYNPTTVLIDPASGLPVYHAFTGADGVGYEWLYGPGGGPAGPVPPH